VSQLLHSVRNLFYVTQIVQYNDFVIGCHARSRGILSFESTFLFVAAVVGYCYRSFATLFIFNIMFWYFTFRILKWFFKIIFQYFYVYTKYILRHFNPFYHNRINVKIKLISYIS